MAAAAVVVVVVVGLRLAYCTASVEDTLAEAVVVAAAVVVDCNRLEGKGKAAEPIDCTHWCSVEVGIVAVPLPVVVVVVVGSLLQVDRESRVVPVGLAESDAESCLVFLVVAVVTVDCVAAAFQQRWAADDQPQT